MPTLRLLLQRLGVLPVLSVNALLLCTEGAGGIALQDLPVHGSLAALQLRVFHGGQRL